MPASAICLRQISKIRKFEDPFSQSDWWRLSHGGQARENRLHYFRILIPYLVHQFAENPRSCPCPKESWREYRLQCGKYGHLAPVR